MKHILQTILFAFFLFSFVNAQIVVLDDFEAGVGRSTLKQHFQVPPQE